MNESEENQGRYHHLNIYEPALRCPQYFTSIENHFRRMCTKKSTINYSAWEIPKSKSKIRHVSLCNSAAVPYNLAKNQMPLLFMVFEECLHGGSPSFPQRREKA
jgi:hypothetical protein